MKLSTARILVLALWSALSFVLWMALVRVLSPLAYRALGSPVEATLAWWLALLLPPLLLGLLSGVVLLRIGCRAPHLALAIYWIVLLLLTLLIGVIAGAPATVLALVNGKTSWAYFAGSCLPALISRRRLPPVEPSTATHG